MSPRVKPRPSNGKPDSSLAEYRSLRAEGNDTLSIGASHHVAFWKYMTVDVLEPEAALNQIEKRALSRATGPAGGYLVPADFDAQITSAARAANVIAGLAREIVTDDGRDLPVPAATAHGTAAWTAESAATAPSDETFAQATLGAFKATTKVVLSEELVTDESVALDAYLADELGQRIGALEEAAYATGSGTGQPLGIFTAGNGVTAVTAATGSATTYKVADLVALMKALPAGYRPRAAWLIAADEFVNLASMTDTAGGLVFPTLQADPPSLFGRPVAITGYAPAPAASARTIAFGDFRTAVTIRRVRGVAIQRQVELHSDNGEQGLRAYRRSDARVVVPDAIRILAHSAT
jgi:HK97 family phage major capsid protein